MGYFVLSRSRETNNFLVDQFDMSVTQEIENRLAVIASDEASDIAFLFSSLKNVTEIFGTITGTVISNNGSPLSDESPWNPYLELKQLPNGSLDNSNSEASSIFLPGTIPLNDSIAIELAALKGLDLFVEGLFIENPEIEAVYFGGNLGETVYYPNINLAATLPLDYSVTSTPWYQSSLKVSQLDNKAVWSIPWQNSAQTGLFVTSSVPVYDTNGEFRGVAGIDFNLSSITDRVGALSIGNSGYSILIDSEGRLLEMPETAYQDFNLTLEEVQSVNIAELSLIGRVSSEVNEVLTQMTSGQSGVRLININGSNRYIAYKPIPIVGFSLGLIVPENELLEDFVATNTIIETQTQETLTSAVGIILIMLAVSALASYGIGTSIISPLDRLTKVANEVAAGNLDKRAEVKSGDEIGVLGRTLNSVTTTAQGLITNLEGAVAERTRDIERRAGHIQAVAEVGKAIAEQRTLEDLLPRAVHLISNRFGYYHVGIFLVDSLNDYVILRAANSKGGEKMLASKYKLKVGVEGIVGTAASDRVAKIALDIGEDAVKFDNPDLPETHSQAALPLVSGGEIFGVLDVQSNESDAFSDYDIPTLQILADQLAIAIQNALLLNEIQEALSRSHRATGKLSQSGWRLLLQGQSAPGYISSIHGELSESNGTLDPEVKKELNKGKPVLSKDQRTLSVPISSRGITIGMMRLEKQSSNDPWSPDEISDVVSFSGEIGNTLDSARLFEDAQRSASLEQSIGEMALKIGATTNIEEILRTTVQELGRQLGGTNVLLELESDLRSDI